MSIRQATPGDREVLQELVLRFNMEVFSLLSGVGIWYALESRRAGAYLWARVKRPLIPLYTVGLFVLLPPQFYFELRTNGGYRGTFWQIGSTAAAVGRLLRRPPGTTVH